MDLNSQQNLKQDLKIKIQKFFKGEVEDDEDTLKKYSHDASVFEIRPMVVVYPKDHNDVKALVKWVSENKEKYPELAITARCAGTDMSGGAIGESIIMDFTRHMNKLISGPGPVNDSSAFALGGIGQGTYDASNHSPAPASITVQPGMFYRDFEKITLEKGLILPCYTASKSLNAIGGMYGNNSAGERTLKYGKTEDYVVEAKVVFADGNEYTVKPLNQIELNKKMTQLDFEGSVYKNIYEIIKKNEEEIKEAKPKVSKNSAGYYIWNVWSGQNSKNSSAFDLNKLLVGSQGTLGITTEITLRLVPNPKHSKLVAIFMKDLGPLGRLVDEILEMNPET
ncbi:MAG: FAD-binding oxidoreductase, partial [bacterium]|nr:FAD-binding oxidoreductase [bacterium]